MGRKELSKRANWQKYSNASGSGNEDTISVILKQHLMNDPNYEVIIKPRDLSHIYGKWGIVPELKIGYKPKNRKAFLEFKKQKDGGNAHERLCKLLAPGIQPLLYSVAGFEHPYFFILTEGLANDAKKKTEISTWFNADGFRDRYLLLQDRKDIRIIIDWFDKVIRPYLEGNKI